MVMAAVAALLGIAAMFRQFAPERYGLPTIAVLDPGVTGQRIDQAGLFGNYFPAPGPGHHPAVLLLGGSEGGLGGGAQQMALALQRRGFAVFHLAYFGAPRQPDTLERIPLELFDRGLDWLKRRPDVDPERLAVIGASKGAEAALLVAARRDDLRAVVAGMPSSVVWNGINPKSGGQSPHSSWTVAGQDIPAMPFADWSPAEGVISVYRSVEDPRIRQNARPAAIPIERAHARILLVCGESETMWPACPMSRMLATRSAQRAGPPVTVLAYRNAGHFVFGPPIAPDHPFYRRLDAYGGTIAGNAAARADSWPKVIAFLAQALDEE